MQLCRPYPTLVQVTEPGDWAVFTFPTFVELHRCAGGCFLPPSKCLLVTSSNNITSSFGIASGYIYSLACNSFHLTFTDILPSFTTFSYISFFSFFPSFFPLFRFSFLFPFLSLVLSFFLHLFESFLSFSLTLVVSLFFTFFFYSVFFPYFLLYFFFFLFSFIDSFFLFLKLV